MSRKFYACQCFFKKGRDAIKNKFGKSIFVFKNIKDRNDFIESKQNENEFFQVTQKEAFAIVDLNKPNSKPCVYSHTQFRELFVLADIKQCYGSSYITIEEL